MINDEKGEGIIEIILGLFMAIFLIWVFSQILFSISIIYGLLFIILAGVAVYISISKK